MGGPELSESPGLLCARAQVAEELHLSSDECGAGDPAISAGDRSSSQRCGHDDDEAVALDGTNYSFRGVANQEFTDKLRRAQEILSHAVPNGDPIQVLSRALDLLIEQHAKSVAEPVRARAAKTTASVPAAASVTPKRSRHIPAAIARAVRRRDEDCCSFTLPDGTRCGSRWKLELDHIKPFALGGESTLENLRLACGAHNLVHARRTFGDDVAARHRPKESRTP